MQQKRGARGELKKKKSKAIGRTSNGHTSPPKGVYSTQEGNRDIRKKPLPGTSVALRSIKCFRVGKQRQESSLNQQSGVGCNVQIGPLRYCKDSHPQEEEKDVWCGRLREKRSRPRTEEEEDTKGTMLRNATEND